MSIRNREMLQRDQQVILDDYQRSLIPPESVAQLPPQGTPTTVQTIARIEQVIGSDPDYGPHLVAKIQSFGGTPRVASDSSAASVICYPTPGSGVGDYAVDEYVELMAVRGAFLAAKL